MPVGASCAIHAFRVGEGSARRFAVPGRRGGFRTSLLRPKGRNCIFFSSIFLEWVAMEERMTHRFCVFFHRGGYRIFCFAPMGSYRIFRFSVFLDGLTMEGRLTHPSVGFSERMKVAYRTFLFRFLQGVTTGYITHLSCGNSRKGGQRLFLLCPQGLLLHFLFYLISLKGLRWRGD